MVQSYIISLEYTYIHTLEYIFVRDIRWYTLFDFFTMYHLLQILYNNVDFQSDIIRV